MASDLRYQRSQELGLTDEQIADTFTKRDPTFRTRYDRSLELGMTPKEIFSKAHDYYSRKKQPENLQNDVSVDVDEDLDRDIERNQAMVTSRMLERLVGTVGNLYQSIPSPLNKFVPAKQLLEKLPTEKQLRQFSEEKSLGYTKPKTDFEEKAGEYAADVASAAIGGGGTSTVLGSMTRTLGIPLAGQLAKEGIERVGGSDKAQQFGKLGTMFLLDLWGLGKGIGQGGARNFGYKKLAEAEKAIPKNAVADVSVFSKKLDSLEDAFKSQLTGPHNSEALRIIKEIREHIKDGIMAANKFPEIRKGINKIIDSQKGFSFPPIPRSVKRSSLENINEVKSALIQAGNRWGRGHSTEFFNAWKEGNQALAVYHKSNDIARWFAKNTKIKDPIAKTIFGIHAYHNPVKALALGAGKKAIELGTQHSIAPVYRFFSSPVLRELYSNVMMHGLKGNAHAAQAGIDKVEKEMKKEKIA